MRQVQIELSTDGAKIKTARNDGLVKTKVVSIQALRDALTQNITFETGLLPHGTRMYFRKDNIEHIIIERPPRITEVQWRDREGLQKYTIPTPWTLWFIELVPSPEGKRHSWSHVYAMKTPLLSLNTLVYHAPWSNVQSAICWGETSLPKWNNLAGLGSLPDLFFAMAFNNDLDHNRYTPFKAEISGVEAEIYSTHSLFKHLDGKETFPNEILCNEETFEKALNYCLGGNRRTWG